MHLHYSIVVYFLQRCRRWHSGSDSNSIRPFPCFKRSMLEATLAHRWDRLAFVPQLGSCVEHNRKRLSERVLRFRPLVDLARTPSSLPTFFAPCIGSFRLEGLLKLSNPKMNKIQVIYTYLSRLSNFP